MKKLILLFLTLIVSPLTFADNNRTEMVLDKVVFQITSKSWVTTHSALVKININATLRNQDLIQARKEIMNGLTKMAQGQWQITQFQRSQDQSGLEKLRVEAQARVDQKLLTNVYKNAKAISKPGISYRVSSINFKPSLQETQKVKADLRSALYKKVNEEITRINQEYKSQKYSVTSIVFIEGSQPIQPRAYEQRKMNTMVMAAAAVPSVKVSNELIMTAMVEAASNRVQE